MYYHWISIYGLLSLTNEPNMIHIILAPYQFCRFARKSPLEQICQKSSTRAISQYKQVECSLEFEYSPVCNQPPYLACGICRFARKPPLEQICQKTSTRAISQYSKLNVHLILSLLLFAISLPTWHVGSHHHHRQCRQILLCDGLEAGLVGGPKSPHQGPLYVVPK